MCEKGWVCGKRVGKGWVWGGVRWKRVGAERGGLEKGARRVGWVGKGCA